MAGPVGSSKDGRSLDTSHTGRSASDGGEVQRPEQPTGAGHPIERLTREGMARCGFCRCEHPIAKDGTGAIAYFKGHDAMICETCADILAQCLAERREKRDDLVAFLREHQVALFQMLLNPRSDAQSVAAHGLEKLLERFGKR